MGTEGQGVTVFQGTALCAKSASNPLKNSQTYQGEMQSLGWVEQFMAKLGLVYVTADTVNLTGARVTLELCCHPVGWDSRLHRKKKVSKHLQSPLCSLIVDVM